MSGRYQRRLSLFCVVLSPIVAAATRRCSRSLKCRWFIWYCGVYRESYVLT